MIASGTLPPCWSCTTSTKCRESRGVPRTTFAANPAAWSLSMFSQVMPRLRPKYFGFGRAWMVRTGTTKRIPSTEASNPPPQVCASDTSAWASINATLALVSVSSRT